MIKSKLQKKLRGYDLSKVLFGAIDISKKEHYGYCFTNDGKEERVIKFSDNHLGANDYWDYLEKRRISLDLDHVVITAESTGTYGVGLLDSLKKKGAKILLVNSKHIKRCKELTDNSPNKTDQKDPRVIGMVLRLSGGYQPLEITGTVAELRNLSNNRERQKVSLGRYYNQLESQVVRIFPEFISVMKGLRTKTAKGLLKDYQSPADFIELGKVELEARIREISRGRLGKDRAEELYDAACCTIGITEGITSISLEISSLVTDVLNREAGIKAVEKVMHKELEKIEWTKYLMSVPGVSTISAAVLIGEVGDFKNIKSAKALEKLAGLNLYEISSGGHNGNKHISKRGRKLLRKMLYMLSLGMIKHNGIFRDVYEKHKAKGMKSPKALVAVSRKLIRVIYALVTKEEMYIKEKMEGTMRTSKAV